MKGKKASLWVLIGGFLVLGGCGTVTTAFREDGDTVRTLKAKKTYCQSVPRIYSGVISGFCYLNSEPKPEKGVDNPGFGQPASNIFPIIAIEALASGLADTLVLPYTVYRQSQDGDIQVYK